MGGVPRKSEILEKIASVDGDLKSKIDPFRYDSELWRVSAWRI